MANISSKPIFVITAFLDDGGKAGWSELYYVAADDYAAALQLWGPTAAARVAIMADSYRIVAARVSDPTVRGDSLFDQSPIYPYNGTWPTAGTSVGSAYSALLLRYESGPFRRGMHLLHGVGDDVFHGMLYSPPAGFPGLLTTFAAQLKLNYYIKQGFGPKATYNPITAVIPIRRGDHKIGRPTGLLRGRRLRKRRR
jgi:hypothetical protein